MEFVHRLGFCFAGLGWVFRMLAVMDLVVVEFSVVFESKEYGGQGVLVALHGIGVCDCDQRQVGDQSVCWQQVQVGFTAEGALAGVDHGWQLEVGMWGACD